MNHVVYTAPAPKPVVAEAPKEKFVWVLTSTEKLAATRAFRTWVEVEAYMAMYHKQGRLDGKNASTADLYNAVDVIVGTLVRHNFWI